MSEMILAVSVRQPWANLIASGRKTIETRSWKTTYRGKLLIVSSLRPAIFPAGYAVAVCRLTGCRQMTREDELRACCQFDVELFSWLLDDVFAIRPFKVRGRLGLYPVECDEGQLACVETSSVETELPLIDCFSPHCLKPGPGPLFR